MLAPILFLSPPAKHKTIFFIHFFYKPNKIASYEKTFLLLVAFVATVVGASAQGQTAPHQRGVYVVRAGQQVRKVVSK